MMMIETQQKINNDFHYYLYKNVNVVMYSNILLCSINTYHHHITTFIYFNNNKILLFIK